MKSIKLQLPRIKFLKSNHGSAQFVLAILFVSVTCLGILFMTKIKFIQAARNYIEDGLSGACLASATIDLKTYGERGKMVMPDYNEILQVFKKSIRANYHLTENDIFQNQETLDGKLDILYFDVYEIKGNTVLKHSLDGTEILDEPVFTTNQVLINNNTIYCKIGFWVKGLFGQKQYITKDECVDIVHMTP